MSWFTVCDFLQDCPPARHCGTNCMAIKDENGCHVCTCDLTPSPHPPDGPKTFEDSGVVCPELKCDLHCERGLIMDENDCTLCECKPHSECPSMSGCKKKCTYGYKTNKRGCPVSLMKSLTTNFCLIKSLFN